VSEEDEQPAGRRSDANQFDRPADNSLERLLTLSDGIFAISMTLLALDLQVPNLGSHQPMQHCGTPSRPTPTATDRSY
jgi:hypothetical protein